MGYRKRTWRAVFVPGDLVRLRGDVDRSIRIVVRLSVHEDGIEYGVRRGAEDVTYHHSFEMVRARRGRIIGFVVAS